jgi:hypothetical protein
VSVISEGREEMNRTVCNKALNKFQWSMVRRYLTMMYSTPRKRHRKRSDKQRNESREAVKVLGRGLLSARSK